LPSIFVVVVAPGASVTVPVAFDRPAASPVNERMTSAKLVEPPDGT
jgi:hypothetical protein